MTVRELQAKVAEYTSKILRTSSPYLKEVYTEQRGRYQHEIRRLTRLKKRI